MFIARVLMCIICCTILSTQAAEKKTNYCAIQESAEYPETPKICYKNNKKLLLMIMEPAHEKKKKSWFIRKQISQDNIGDIGAVSMTGENYKALNARIAITKGVLQGSGADIKSITSAMTKEESMPPFSPRVDSPIKTTKLFQQLILMNAHYMQEFNRRIAPNSTIEE